MADIGALGYTETDQRLAVRIRAHQAFANIQLEDWLGARLENRSPGRVLEIACGDGNLFPVLAKRAGPDGLVVGFDVSDSLLRAAQQRARDLPTPAIVLTHDFDQRFPFLDEDFDLTLCAYAAYYVRDADAWIGEVLRVTRPGGQILVLGPTDDNAAELYSLNERVTGVGHLAETDYTTARLEGEFLPLLRARLGDRVTSETLDRRLEFPSAREFAHYYQATWLYEKTCARLGRTFSLEEIETRVGTLTLSKKVLAINARA